MSSTQLSTGLGSDLRRLVSGRVLVPGDEDFETARRPWNLAVEQPVAAVVEARDALDVSGVVGFAALNGLGVATQPNGHGASGAVDGVILLRTGQLGELSIDASARIARAGAGVGWGEVLRGASPHGLLGMAGSSPVVSVVGHTLGGGLSWFSRKHGFAADSVRAFDVVTADGIRCRVDAQTDPELFWALRGGGGDFAVVTAIEFDLHPAPELYGGRMLWPSTCADEVLATFREVTATAPDELTTWFELIEFPDLPVLPPALRGLSAVVVDAAYLGSARDGADLLRRFDTVAGRLSDTRAAMPVAELGGICAEPTAPSPGISHAHLLTRLDETALLAATRKEGSISPLVAAQVRHLGGALTRPGEHGASGLIAEPYLFYLFGGAAVPDQAREVRQCQADIGRALVPFTSGRKPFTYLGVDERAANAFPRDVLARLRDVKRRSDPGDTLRSNFPVKA